MKMHLVILLTGRKEYVAPLIMMNDGIPIHDDGHG